MYSYQTCNEVKSYCHKYLVSLCMFKDDQTLLKKSIQTLVIAHFFPQKKTFTHPDQAYICTTFMSFLCDRSIITLITVQFQVDLPLSKQASNTRCPFRGAPEYPGGVTISLLTFPTRASSAPVSPSMTIMQQRNVFSLNTNLSYLTRNNSQYCFFQYVIIFYLLPISANNQRIKKKKHINRILIEINTAMQ